MQFEIDQLIPQKILECQLCLKQCEETYQMETLEQTLEICLVCQNYIKEKYFRNFIENYIRDRNNMKIDPYCSKVKFKTNQTKKIYNLKKQTCPICLKNKICTKICINNHYACQSCLRIWVSTRFENEYVRCISEGCGKLDDFIIFEYIPRGSIHKWYALNYQLFCYNYNCSVELIIQPFKPIHGNIIQYSEKQYKCKKCNTKICRTCWTEHSGSCKTENEKLFQQFCKKNKVIKCPKCNIISQPMICNQNSKQIQHCPLCNTNFCATCNSVNINIFPNENLEVGNYNSTCQDCKIQYYSKSAKFSRFFQRNSQKEITCHTVLITICSTLLFILFLPGYQFLQVSKIVNDAVENSILVAGRQKAPYILCCCGPLIAILTIASILVLYALLFVPLFVKNCYDKLNGQYL